jgi:hypothetical protein
MQKYNYFYNYLQYLQIVFKFGVLFLHLIKIKMNLELKKAKEKPDVNIELLNASIKTKEKAIKNNSVIKK